MQLTFNHAARLIHQYWHHGRKLAGMLSRYFGWLVFPSLFFNVCLLFNFLIKWNFQEEISFTILRQILPV